MIQLNYRDAKPIYEQIKDGLRKLVITNSLIANEKLPSVPQIDLKIALDEFDGALHFIDRQRGVVVLRDIDFAHTGFTP